MKNNLLIVVSIAIALIGCGPNNGPIVPSNQGNDSLPMDSIVMPFEIWLDTTYANVVATNPATITLVGTYKYNGFSHFYDDLLTITFVSGNHFEGRTISNVFSGEYVISGNDVLITHVRCSQFREKVSEANTLHSFVVGGFTATETADGITLSKDGYHLEFINTENEEQYPAEYSYYSNNSWSGDYEFDCLTVTMLPNYIGVNTTRSGILEMQNVGLNNFFDKYGISVDSHAECLIGYTEYSMWVLLPILGLSVIEDNFELARNFPTNDTIQFVVGCFAYGNKPYPFSDEIVLITKPGVTVEDIKDLLTVNGIQESTYSLHSSDWYGGVACNIRLNNVETGTEIIPVISILSNYDNVKEASLNHFGNTQVW